MITTVVVNGVEQDPSLIPAQVTVLHGRQEVRQGPEASNATLIFLRDPMPGWLYGDELKLLDDEARPMFTGRITDVGLRHGIRGDGTTYGLFTVTASGPVAGLGFRSVGDEPWPAEAGSVRAERILTLAETPYLIDGAADAVILPRDVDSRPARDLLEDLIQSTGAAVVDLPDGRVMYQPLAERARAVKPLPWADFDPALTWAGFDAAQTWAGFNSWHSADSEWPLPLPPSAVEWEPEWSVNADISNHVRVGYGTVPEGGEQAWTETTDSASITRHGRRYQYVGTQLRDLPDAQAYASWILTTRTIPRWSLGDVTVLLEELDESARSQVLALTCGDQVTIEGMPTPAPALVAEGVVEGWTYVMWGDAGQLFERITLHTSNLLDSLVVPAWADYPAGYLWQDHSPLLTWADIVKIPA